MKKRLFAGFLLLALAVGGMGAVHAQLIQRFHQPEVTETVLYGDPADAAGLTLNLHIEAERRLFWDSTIRPGQEPEHKCWFQARPDYPEMERDSTIYLDIHHSFSGGFWDVERDSLLRGVQKPLEDMLSGMQVGESRSRTVRYRDYYEFFPLDVNIRFADWYEANWDQIEWERDQADIQSQSRRELLEGLSDTFRFPVPEDYELELSVMREEDNEASVECNARGKTLWFDTLSTTDDENVYFAPVVRESEGEKLADYSNTPGYGIYALPNKKEKSDPQLSIDELKLVYPMPDSRILLSMEKDRYGDRLLLTTLENGVQTLWVVDPDSGKEVQAIPVPELGAASVYYVIEQDYVICLGEKMSVFSRGEDGLLCHELTAAYPGDLPELDGKMAPEYYGQGEAFAFDGERLARAFQVEERGNSYRADCGAYLMVYDRDGLVCALRYESSLSRNTCMGDGRDCNHDRYKPMTVSWN